MDLGFILENAEGQLPSIDEDAARAVDLLSSISPRNARHIFTDCSDIHLKSEKSFQTGRGRLDVTKKLGISRDIAPAGAAPERETLAVVGESIVQRHPTVRSQGCYGSAGGGIFQL